MIDDGTEAYIVDANGGRTNATSINLQIDGETVFRFDSENGILEISIEEPLVKQLIESYGLPAPHITFQEPFSGECHHFRQVREIRPLPRSDGTFFMMVPKQAAPPPKKHWFWSLFN